MPTTLKQTEPSATLSLASPQEVPSLWPVVSPMLREAIGMTSGRLDEATVFKALATGEFHLWLVVQDGLIGAFVTQICTWPTGLRVAHFVLAGGREHRAWIPLMAKVEEWARANNCQILDASGRKGWQRSMETLEGWKVMAIQMEKDIA
jgi:hypothetical protein